MNCLGRRGCARRRRRRRRDYVGRVGGHDVGCGISSDTKFRIEYWREIMLYCILLML